MRVREYSATEQRQWLRPLVGSGLLLLAVSGPSADAMAFGWSDATRLFTGNSVVADKPDPRPAKPEGPAATAKPATEQPLKIEGQLKAPVVPAPREAPTPAATPAPAPPVLAMPGTMITPSADPVGAEKPLANGEAPPAKPPAISAPSAPAPRSMADRLKTMSEQNLSAPAAAPAIPPANEAGPSAATPVDQKIPAQAERAANAAPVAAAPAMPAATAPAPQNPAGMTAPVSPVPPAPISPAPAPVEVSAPAVESAPPKEELSEDAKALKLHPLQADGTAIICEAGCGDMGERIARVPQVSKVVEVAETPGPITRASQCIAGCYGDEAAPAHSAGKAALPARSSAPAADNRWMTTVSPTAQPKGSESSSVPNARPQDWMARINRERAAEKSGI